MKYIYLMVLIILAGFIVFFLLPRLASAPVDQLSDPASQISEFGNDEGMLDTGVLPE